MTAGTASATVGMVLPSRPLPLDGIRTVGFRTGASFVKRIFPWPVCGIILNCTTGSFQSIGSVGKANGMVGGMAPPAGRVGGTAIDCLEVQLSPLVAAAVLDVSPVEINDRLITLDEIWGADAERLRSRLVEANSWDLRFALVHDGLAQRYRESHRVDPEITDAWRRIRRTGGQVPVAALAHGYGWSRTRFWSRFKNQVGVSPKRAARIVRFDRALRLLSAGAELATVAADCGYVDQSHLNRDFLEFAATTPGEIRDDPLWSGDPSWALDELGTDRPHQPEHTSKTPTKSPGEAGPMRSQLQNAARALRFPALPVPDDPSAYSSARRTEELS